jgi:hypothetical protein
MGARCGGSTRPEQHGPGASVVCSGAVRAAQPPGVAGGGRADLPWERAFELVPQDALMMAVDSLETWAPRSDQARGKLLRALRRHGCRFKFVIAAAKADGSLAGDGLLERAWDASIFVQKKVIRTGKCRWSEESTWERYRDRRGGARLNVRRVIEDDEDDNDGGRKTASSRAGRERECRPRTRPDGASVPDCATRFRSPIPLPRTRTGLPRTRTDPHRGAPQRPWG